ncbi:MAG: nitrilase-related carbon-nitrogen hydrolase [Bacillota bacterium]|jgi:predicted amidohydrolase|nr:carbon-nitrogen hydrolase family protein [Candidatus Fermentithermobacillaceae bacterium]
MAFSAALIQHEAYDTKSAGDGLARVLDLIDQAAGARPGLVVLPECSYPGYYLGLEENPRRALSGWEHALRRFREKARLHKVHLVAGTAELDGDKAYNSAYLIGPDGEVIGRYRKTFLWHFDSRWFTPGDEYRVFDTPLGKIGILICADGRLPEIARVLALKGAEIIVDPTNWVASGSDIASLRNAQPDWIIPTRALENGVWFLCANKVGSEAESVVSCGQSMVVSPDGAVQVKGSNGSPEIITATVDVNPRDKQKALALRREWFREEYSLLLSPNERVPLASILGASLSPSGSLSYLAVVQMDRDISLQEFLSSSTQLARRMAEQGAGLIVFPELPVTVMRDFARPITEALLPVSIATGATIAVTTKVGLRPVTTLLDPKGKVTTLGAESTSSQVIDLGGTRTGFLLGNQGFVPEEARLLFLKGADLIVWQTDSGTGMEKQVAFTRAIENRVFVALANCASKSPERTSMIVSPGGRLLAETFPSSRQGIMAQISPAESRVKEIVPGTDAFRNRIPSLYGPLGSTQKN